MKKTLLILLFFPIVGFGQFSGFELQFNNLTQDYVEITNASSLIANETSFTISGWVYPESNTTHGGLMGFRNNIDADFYLLQLQNTNNIEARFRNSNGANFDIIAINVLDFNQWQHLTFTYDGSYIRLYKDGILFDSTAANGTIVNTSQALKFGTLDWQGSGFYMNGKLDELRLWNTALSASDIINWMCMTVNFNHPYITNLLAYWKLDEGTGSTILDYYSPASPSLIGTLYAGTSWQPNSNCTNFIMQDLCDSIDINFTSLDLSTTPALVNFDLNVLYNSLYSFGYCGFVLLDNNGDTIAYENINTAGNVFGISAGTTESRSLDIIQIFTIPFYGELHLIEGFFAGSNLMTQCIIPFDILTSPSWDCISAGNCQDPGTGNGQYFSLSDCQAACLVNNISDTWSHNNRILERISNVLGESIEPIKNTLLFYIYNDGSVEKQVLIE